jgi:hypothetical protein
MEFTAFPDAMLNGLGASIFPSYSPEPRFTAPIPYEFLCASCHAPWDPESAITCTSSQGVYCHRCYPWLVMQQHLLTRGHPSTPPRQFARPHLLLRGIAGRLQVFCDNQPQGCPWTGARCELANHLSQCSHGTNRIHRLLDEEIPPELLCPICLDPMVDPVQLEECEHAFCKHCITTHLTGATTCPICRNHSTTANFVPLPNFIRSLLDSQLLRHQDANRTTAVEPSADSEPDPEPPLAAAEPPLDPATPARGGSQEAGVSNPIQDGEGNRMGMKFTLALWVLVLMLILILVALVLGFFAPNCSSHVQGEEPLFRSTRQLVSSQPFQRVPDSPKSWFPQAACTAISKSGQLALQYSSLLYSFFLGKAT